MIRGESKIWIVVNHQAYINGGGRSGGTQLVLHAIKIHQAYTPPSKPTHEQLLEVMQDDSFWCHPDSMHARDEHYSKHHKQLDV